MSAVRGALAGALGLTMLQVIVSSDQATSNASGVIGFVTRGLARWFNPYTPLIPDLRKPAAPSPGLPQPPAGGQSQIIIPPGARDILPAPANGPRSSLDQRPT